MAGGIAAGRSFFSRKRHKVPSVGRKDRDQLQLFEVGSPPPEPPDEASPELRRGSAGPAPATEEVEALARALPPEVRLGTSSWSFPGWAGLVYDRKHSPSRLAREGLEAYARHPLLRSVGLDRTHYAPVAADELARYTEQVPEGFRFLVKAHEAVTLARYPDRPRYGAQRGRGNALFLDPVYAAEQVVAPAVEGLGERLGAILFQFAPQDLGAPGYFAEDLGAFLAALPRGPLYAVELRNRELLTAEYAAALAAADACHCVNVHPRMPDARVQAHLGGVGRAPALIVRWLLGPGLTYEEAGRRYAPFDRMAAPDPFARKALAELAREAVDDGRSVLVTVNNNAEGSAPLSIVELAKEILAARSPLPSGRGGQGVRA